MEITVKAARVNVGLTQKQAAEKLGICIPALARYEKGEAYPNAKTIKKMIEVYGVSFDDLVFAEQKTV